jgi:hypothetical protein
MLYNNIDELPLKLFEKISTTGDIKLLGEGTPEQILQAWDDIQRQFFDSFKMKDKQKNTLLAKADYLNLMMDYFETGDSFSRTMANIELAMIDITEGKHTPFIKICVSLSKALEMRVDYNSITTSEFFYYIDLAEETAKHYKK